MCFICVAQSNRANTQTGNHIEYKAEAVTGGNFGYAAASSINTSQYINTILAGVSWSATAGTAATVTFSFDFSGADSNIIYTNNPYQFSSSEQAATRLAMADISKVVGVTFVEAATSSAAQLHFYNGNLTLGGTTTGVAGYFTDSNNLFISAAIGMDDQTAGFSKGNWQYVTLLHEIGHVLGLKHAGNYNGNEDGPFLPSNLDNTDYTVMAYDDGVDGEATTLRDLDVAALVSLYGTGTGSSNSGNTTGTSGNDVINGTSSAEDIKGGLGSDVITGSGGNDTIYGGRGLSDNEDSADTIRGGAGDDLLFGNYGNDVIYGGDSASSNSDGNDTVYGGIGLDTIYGNEGDDYLAGGGGIAHPQDDSDYIYGGAGNDFIIGNGGNDVIYADNSQAASTDGNDTVYGGLGDDQIYGGGGNDQLHGQIGSDYLVGGAGADIFVFHTGGGRDIIADFTVGTDILRITSNIDGSGITTAAAALANFSVIEGWGYLQFGSNDNAVWLENVISLTEASIQII